MSNMRNAYNRIYHIHNINEEPPDQQQLFFFSGEEKKDNNKDKSEHSESKPAGEQMMDKKPKFAQKTVSAPFILPPPKVEDRQIIHSREQKEEIIEEKFLMGQPKTEKEQNPYKRGKGVRFPNKIKDILTPFSPMLSWSPSFPSKFTSSLYYQASRTGGQDEDKPHFMEMAADIRGLQYPRGDKGPVEEKISSESLQEIEFDVEQEPFEFDQQEDSLSNLNDHSEIAEEVLALLDASSETNSDLAESRDKSSSADGQLAYLPELKKADTSFLENEFSSLLEDDFITKEDSYEGNFQSGESSSGRYFHHNGTILENEFVSLMEESSSSESAIKLPTQDEAFALLAESFDENEKEPSFFIEKEEYTRKFGNEESSSAKDEPIFSLEDQPGTDEESHGEETESKHDLAHKKFAESSSFDGELSLLLKKAYSILDSQPGKDHSLQEKFLGLLEEPFSASKDYSALLKEAYISASETADERKSERYRKVSALLQDFSAMLDDSDYFESDAAGKEEMVDSAKEFHESSQLAEKFSSELESSDRKGAAYDKDDSENHDESSSMYMYPEKLKEEIRGSLSLQRQCPRSVYTPTIVKIPVLVAKTDIEIDLFECLPVDCPACCITSLEWSVESLRCHPLLPSNTVFIKGMLIVHISYEYNGSMQLLKLPVQVEKTIDLKWDFPPEMPVANTKNEFMFQDEHENDFHYEFFQQFTETIFCQLRSIHVVWHEDKGADTMLEIQGRVVLWVDFLQEQYVDLNHL